MIVPMIPGADATWRNPTPDEVALLARLLEEDFVGRDALRAQWESAMVHPIDDDGCLRIRAGAGTPACPNARTGIPYRPPQPPVRTKLLPQADDHVRSSV